MQLRIVSWNMNVRARSEQWAALRSLDPDVALLQEWRQPEGFQADGYWYSQEYLPGRHTAVWSKWPLQNTTDFPKSADIDWEPYRPALEGCVVSADVMTPVKPLSVTSVYAYPVALKPEQLITFDPDDLRLPSSKKVWPADLIWWALKDWASTIDDAVLGGDWNSSRILDDPKPRGNQEFFDRMRDCGWHEIARKFYPNERDAATWRRKNARSMQLDHFFISSDLALSATDVQVIRTEAFNQASDHWPICLDLELDS